MRRMLPATVPMYKNKRNIFRLSGAVFCCWLAGCAVGPDYHPIDTRMPDTFIGASSDSLNAKEAKTEQPVIDTTIWWKSLNDPELDSLIDRAIASNLDLEIALDRVQEARTQEVVVLGGALPEIGASLGGAAGTGSNLARGRVSGPLVAAENTGHLNHVTHIAGFDSTWELDLVGKYRRAIEAAEYDTQAAIAARNNVLISVIADVARAYTDMRVGQMRLAVVQKIITSAEAYSKLTQERYNYGITNELDARLAERQLASFEAEKAPLVAQIHAAQYVIAVLLGVFPEDMANELEKPGMVPFSPDKIETGLPISLLRRRPDIQEAEREVAAATARIGEAEADLFPHVSLLGGVGIQGKGLGKDLDAGFIWSVGPSVSWSLLDFGTLDALVDKADLRTKEKLAQYKRTLLNAVREVDTSIAAYKAQIKRLASLEKALAASQRAVSLATQRYDRGLTDALNVVDSERQEYELEAQYVSAQQNVAEEFIRLYKALGGGWEQYQSFPPIHQPQPAVIAAFTRLLSSNDPQKE
ncbi:MAG: efflux transporter outer membrane subunit [candidate division NC10 bacterium]|nr:efflux transporter outer membrane subunit [candidate division NC10 bacterium]